MSNGIKTIGRQPAIDIAKLVAAILVITIHTNPLAEISQPADFILTQYIARTAVPFFVICTGFFTVSRIGFDFSELSDIKKARNIILKSAWKIFKLYLICSFLYLIPSVIDWIMNSTISIMSFVDWGISFFLNGSYYHLWYLIEVCYALIILALILPLLKKPVICGVLAVLLWSAEAICYGYTTLLPESIQNMIALTEKVKMPFESIIRVLPLLLIGFYISKARRKRLFYGIGLLISAIICGAELYYVSSINGGKLFMTLPLAYFLFGFIHSFDPVIKEKNTVAYAKISTFIYVVHPAFIWLFQFVTDLPNLGLFIIVTFLSITTGFVYYRMAFTIKSKARRA